MGVLLLPVLNRPILSVGLLFLHLNQSIPQPPCLLLFFNKKYSSLYSLLSLYKTLGDDYYFCMNPQDKKEEAESGKKRRRGVDRLFEML